MDLDTWERLVEVSCEALQSPDLALVATKDVHDGIAKEVAQTEPQLASNPSTSLTSGAVALLQSIAAQSQLLLTSGTTAGSNASIIQLSKAIQAAQQAVDQASSVPPPTASSQLPPAPSLGFLQHGNLLQEHLLSRLSQHSKPSTKPLIPGGPCENPFCGVSEAPQWRRIEKKLVCNRCGMYYHRHARFPDWGYLSGLSSKAAPRPVVVTQRGNAGSTPPPPPASGPPPPQPAQPQAQAHPGPAAPAPAATQKVASAASVSAALAMASALGQAAAAAAAAGGSKGPAAQAAATRLQQIQILLRNHLHQLSRIQQQQLQQQQQQQQPAAQQEGQKAPRSPGSRPAAQQPQASGVKEEPSKAAAARQPAQQQPPQANGGQSRVAGGVEQRCPSAGAAATAPSPGMQQSERPQPHPESYPESKQAHLQRPQHPSVQHPGEAPHSPHARDSGGSPRSDYTIATDADTAGAGATSRGADADAWEGSPGGGARGGQARPAGGLKRPYGAEARERAGVVPIEACLHGASQSHEAAVAEALAGMRGQEDRERRESAGSGRAQPAWPGAERRPPPSPREGAGVAGQQGAQRPKAPHAQAQQLSPRVQGDGWGSRAGAAEARVAASQERPCAGLAAYSVQAEPGSAEVRERRSVDGCARSNPSDAAALREQASKRARVTQEADGRDSSRGLLGREAQALPRPDRMADGESMAEEVQADQNLSRVLATLLQRQQAQALMAAAQQQRQQQLEAHGVAMAQQRQQLEAHEAALAQQRQHQEAAAAQALQRQEREQEREQGQRRQAAQAQAAQLQELRQLLLKHTEQQQLQHQERQHMAREQEERRERKRPLPPQPPAQGAWVREGEAGGRGAAVLRVRPVGQAVQDGPGLLEAINALQQQHLQSHQLQIQQRQREQEEEEDEEHLRMLLLHQEQQRRQEGERARRLQQPRPHQPAEQGLGHRDEALQRELLSYQQRQQELLLHQQVGLQQAQMLKERQQQQMIQLQQLQQLQHHQQQQQQLQQLVDEGYGLGGGAGGAHAGGGGGGLLMRDLQQRAMLAAAQQQHHQQQEHRGDARRDSSGARGAVPQQAAANRNPHHHSQPHAHERHQPSHLYQHSLRQQQQRPSLDQQDTHRAAAPHTHSQPHAHSHSHRSGPAATGPHGADRDPHPHRLTSPAGQGQVDTRRGAPGRGGAPAHALYALESAAVEAAGGSGATRGGGVQGGGGGLSAGLAAALHASRGGGGPGQQVALDGGGGALSQAQAARLHALLNAQAGGGGGDGRLVLLPVLDLGKPSAAVAY